MAKQDREQPREINAGYQPSKAELEEDMSTKAMPGELAQAVVGRPSPPNPASSGFGHSAT